MFLTKHGQEFYKAWFIGIELTTLTPCFDNYHLFTHYID